MADDCFAMLSTMLHRLYPNLLTMKTTLILLLALGWPVSFFAQSVSTPTAAQLLAQAERLLNQNADSAALACAKKAIALIRPNTDYTLEGRAYLLAGRAQYNLGYPEDAAIPLQKALKLLGRIENDSLMLDALVLLSAAMGDRETPELESALAYLNEARDLAVKRRDTLQLAKIYINIANVWDEQEDYDTALVYNYLCEDLLKDTPYQLQNGQNYYGMGKRLLELYIEKGKEQDLRKAGLCLQQAVDIFHRLDEPAREADARNAAGAAALYSEDFRRAKNELMQSLDISGKIQDSVGLLNVYYNLATLAETEGKNSDAVRALTNLVTLLKQVGDASDYQFVREQFSDRKGKLSITLIENKINNLLEKERNQRNEQIMLVGFSMFATLTVGGYFYHRQKMRAQRALMLQQLDNLLKAQEIEFVRARLEGEEAGRHKIARKIHDGVGGLLVSAKWNLESVLEELSSKEKKVAERLNENIQLQNQSYQTLRQVVYELEYERVPWWDDLRKFCEQLGKARKTEIRFFAFNMDESVEGNLGEEARLVTQELIINALKHAEASEINVQLSRIDHILSIVVEDNGKGFNPDTVAHGVGLHSIQERVGRLGGSISFETGKGAGTSVFVDIPLKPVNILDNNPLLYGSN